MDIDSCKILTFDKPYLVHKINDTLTSPQKCKIQQKFEFPAGSMIILKCDDNRTFLCRLFYLNENYDDKCISYVDDSVEVNPKHHHQSEIKFIHEIQMITEELKTFQEISINVELDIHELDLNLIKDSRSLEKVVISVLKNYKFTQDCSISCQKYGISKVHVNLTDGGSGNFGGIKEDARVKIVRISIKSHLNHHHKPLGGLESAQNLLENLITINLEYAKNATKFNFRPGNQGIVIGPVGCGKTSLIQNLARKHSCITFEISGDIFKPFPGETEESIQDIYKKVQLVSNIVGKNQLILILIENVENFCPRFNDKMKENSHTSRIAAMIFSIMDEISLSTLPLIVIGTTSKLELLNDSARRSSRLGNCEVILDMPNEVQRREIVEKIVKEIPLLLPHSLLNSIAQNSPGFVGADLENLCINASRENCDISSAFERAFKTMTPSVMRENLGLVTRSSLTLENIGGMEELKKTLRTSVLGPLRHPERFHKFGLKSPSGILLYGPSGCAKTTIVKCLAGESKMTLISVSSAEIYSPYVGEAEKFLVKLFNQARMNAPTILFFDEIDTIVGNRSVSGGTNDSHLRILSTLLTEIDGFGSADTKTVLIIGATNKPHMIDDALMRPGRFDKLIHVPAPDLKSRENILHYLMAKIPISNEVSIEDIANRTENFSGADLQNLCNEAAMCAATKDFNADKITKQDFDDVLTYLRPSLTKAQIDFFINYQNKN